MPEKEVKQVSDRNHQGLGDGQDNMGQAIQKGGEAIKQFSAAAAEKAAAATAEATSAAAGASVATAAQGGQVIAGMAAGTAAGGPVGAALAAAWAMRHTLFKILICVCLILLFLIAAIVSLPSIVFNQVFRTDPDAFDPNMPTDPRSVYFEMAASVSECVGKGHAHALAEVDRIISAGGYDRELSMGALINHAQAGAGYDVSFVLAAYSASMGQRGTTRSDMQTRLCAVVPQMFPVTYVERETERTEYVEVYDEDEGTYVLEPRTVIVRYIEATIHPFNQSVILIAFDIDPDATFYPFNITYAQAILNMSIALRRTIHGAFGGGSVPPLTDAELIAFLEQLDTTPARRELIRVSLSLVGRVPYFWGGKPSGPGWDDAWNTPRLVTAPGSRTSGTMQPWGLDCSGFIDWAYLTAFGTGIPGGTWHQWYASYPITAAELRPGDLGFIRPGGAGANNHVLIYAGTRDGRRLWIHSEGGSGVIMNTPSYAIPHLRRARGFDLDSFIPPIGGLHLTAGGHENE